MQPAPKPTAEEKMMVQRIIAEAQQKGVVVLYPTASIEPDAQSRDIRDTFWDIWGDNGTFRTVKIVGFSDLIDITGIDIGELDDDTLSDIAYEDVHAVYQAPTGYESTEDRFCFWSDDNPYPGTKDLEPEKTDVESSR